MAVMGGPMKNSPTAAETRPARLELRFHECEHSGDLRAYEAALRSIGAKVVRSRLCSEAESAEIEVEVADYAAFRKRFAAHNDLDGLGGVLTKRWLD